MQLWRKKKSLGCIWEYVVLFKWLKLTKEVLKYKPLESLKCLRAHSCVKQRQRIRELILKQQQQRIAIRQERGPQDSAGTLPGPRPWTQEAGVQQGEMFNRPPPPYPGQGAMRGPMRFPAPFPGDQRFPFPTEGQGPRTPLPGDPNLRHQGPRLVLHHCT